MSAVPSREPTQSPVPDASALLEEFNINTTLGVLFLGLSPILGSRSTLILVIIY